MKGDDDDGTLLAKSDCLAMAIVKSAFAGEEAQAQRKRPAQLRRRVEGQAHADASGHARRPGGAAPYHQRKGLSDVRPTAAELGRGAALAVPTMHRPRDGRVVPSATR